jgi:SpoIID/LytB domain protein
LRAINWVELETYLRAVVPSELGPEVWPQLEALKAQAVAARRTRSPTPRSSTRTATTSAHRRAARRTAAPRRSIRSPIGPSRKPAGEIAIWQGKPIDALYTATCGGHTEDAKEIFPEQAAPYLVGVRGRAEDEALARTRRVVFRSEPDRRRDGFRRGRHARRVDARGRRVFGDSPPERLVKPPRKNRSDAATLRSWTTALGTAFGRPAPEGPPCCAVDACARGARDRPAIWAGPSGPEVL